MRAEVAEKCSADENRSRTKSAEYILGPATIQRLASGQLPTIDIRYGDAHGGTEGGTNRDEDRESEKEGERTSRWRTSRRERGGPRNFTRSIVSVTNQIEGTAGRRTIHRARKVSSSSFSRLLGECSPRTPCPVGRFRPVSSRILSDGRGRVICPAKSARSDSDGHRKVYAARCIWSVAGLLRVAWQNYQLSRLSMPRYRARFHACTNSSILPHS